jgi:hypothetical protein
MGVSTSKRNVAKQVRALRAAIVPIDCTPNTWVISVTRSMKVWCCVQGTPLDLCILWIYALAGQLAARCYTKRLRYGDCFLLVKR